MDQKRHDHPSMYYVWHWFPRKSRITAIELVHATFSVVVRFLVNSLHSVIFFICGQIPTLTFAADRLGKISWRYLKAADSLTSAVTNCFLRPNFKCNGGNTTSRDPTVAFIWRYPSAHWLLWQASPVVPKIIRKLDKAASETHQKGYHFVVADNLPNVLFIFQDI